MNDIVNNVSFTYDSMNEAFPEVDPGVQPFGSRILVQVRSAKTKTKGGIILTTDTKIITRFC